MMLMLSVFSPLALATDYHVCDCQPGADAACVPGDDASDGTDPASPWRSFAQARAAFGSTLADGDALRFCRGGAFSTDGGAWVNDRCTASQPCVIGAYDAPGGGSSAPLIRSEGSTAFDLSSPGEAVQQEGVIIEGLDLVCTDCTAGMGVGVFLYNDVDHVTLRDLHISGFGIGVQLAGSNPCAAWDTDCDGQSSDLSVEATTIEGSLVMGFLGAGDRLRITDSQLVENGVESAFHHNLYVGDAGRTTTGIELRGNLLHRSAWQGHGSCQGSSLVVHGQHDDLAIVGNTVREDPGGAAEGCWGITVDAAYDTPEAFQGAVIAGNTVENVGNVSIGLSACVDCVVENNVVYGGQPFATTGILAPDRAPGPGDTAVAGLTVRNNSIFLDGGGTGISLPDEVDGHTIVSNAIQTSGGDCFLAGGAAEDWAAFSHNICAGGDWVTGVGPLSAWQALGLGTGSLEAAPGFEAPAAGDWALTKDSPARDAGHPALSAVDDRHGTTRDAAPDAGAVESSVAESGGPDTGGPDTGDTTETGDASDTGAATDGPERPENGTESSEASDQSTDPSVKDEEGCATAAAPWALGWLAGLALLARRRPKA